MTKPTIGTDNPRPQLRRSRIRIAVNRFFGIGPKGPQTIGEIATYLRVSPEDVLNYLNSTEGEEIKRWIDRQGDPELSTNENIRRFRERRRKELS